MDSAELRFYFLPLFSTLSGVFVSVPPLSMLNSNFLILSWFLMCVFVQLIVCTTITSTFCFKFAFVLFAKYVSLPLFYMSCCVKSTPKVAICRVDLCNKQNQAAKDPGFQGRLRSNFEYYIYFFSMYIFSIFS